MEDRNCQLLFEYLRSILYDPKPASLDIELLDEPFQKLGMGLQYLDHAVREMKTYSAALSNGNLTDFTPSRDNFLCENLKNIHANLNHLTWQAKQVAKGDYSQTVSYLGEFSEAFNTMTKQLREREEFLKEEAEREKNHADMVDNYNGLLLDLIKRSKEDILVTSINDPRILYSSRNNIEKLQNYELYKIFLEKQKAGQLKKASDEASYEWTWDAEDSSHHFYRITTALMEWQGEEAYAHIILEVTKDKLEQDKLEQEAYFDTLTQIGNRCYFQKKLDELLDTGNDLIFCYCDLDHLKYVNDTYGHQKGDEMIRRVADTLSAHLDSLGKCYRIGGDEFVFLSTTADSEKEFLKLQRDFEASLGTLKLPDGSEYPITVAMGYSVLTHNMPRSMDDVVREADAKMYEAKRRMKTENRG